jgi:hypothetical protein
MLLAVVIELRRINASMRRRRPPSESAVTGDRSSGAVAT